MNEQNEWQATTEWSLRDYVDLVIRRWKIIFATFSVFVVVTLAYVVSQRDQYYSATTFVIDVQSSSLFNPRQAYYGFWGEEERKRQIQFYQALLNSRIYQELLSDAIAADSVLRKIRPAADEVQYAIQNISLNTSQKTDLITLSSTAHSPIVAHRVALNAMRIFVSRAREVKSEESRNVTDYIEKQKEIAGKKLEETERMLQEFSKNVPSFKIGQDESGLLNKLMELELQLTDIQTQRELAEANIAAYDARLRELNVTNPPGLGDANTPEARALYNELDALNEERNRLLATGAPHAQVAALEARINQKKDQLYQAIINNKNWQNPTITMERNMADQIRENRIKEELNLYILKNRERYYRSLVENYRRENPKLIDHAIEEAKLKRSKQVLENLYNILLEKGEEARIIAATGSGGIRIIDEPSLPLEPIPKNSARKIMLGMILGLGLGFGLALVKEFLDHSIRSQDVVERQLGLPVIGAIPEIPSNDGFASSAKWSLFRRPRLGELNQQAARHHIGVYQRQLLSALKARDPIVDAYRTLRTNLQFSSVDKPIKKLLITSAIPGEGKTLTAANLAISFSETGKKVILVDGDLRKPKVHEVFGFKKSPGFSDFLVTNLPLEKIIYPTKTPNLFVITSGTLPPNPAEMIASQRTTDFLQKIEKTFDVVIIDSPPLNLVTDAMIFSSKVDHVLLVIRFASTQVRMVADALSVLQRAQAHVMGAILNAVKVSPGYGYYRSYYSYYYSEQGGEKEKRR